MTFGSRAHYPSRTMSSSQPTAAPESPTDNADPSPLPTPTGAERCLNCDSELTGRYCTHCGQDARFHVHSIRHALGELLEEISQADARVWRTLKVLAFQPGELTCEYLRGKRARYTPPFRLYIALSVLLFLVALVPDGSESVGTVTETKPVTASEIQEATSELDSALEDVPKAQRAFVREQLLKAVAKLPADQQMRVAAGLAEACASHPLGLAVFNNGIASGLSLEKVRANCKLIVDPSAKFLTTIADYAPKMMVFFLPLIACFGKLLYLGSRRYYIGHLVFFVHFHAFAFVALATGDLISSLGGLSRIGWIDTLSNLAFAAMILSLPIYLYKAMRHVYGQSRAVTRLKFVLLVFGYLISFFISFLLLAAFVALQIEVPTAQWKGVFNIS